MAVIKKYSCKELMKLEKNTCEELHNLCASPRVIKVTKSKKMRWTGHVECMEEKGNAYGIMVRRLGGKRQVEASRHGKEDNIKINFKVLGWSALDLINIARVANNIPFGARNSGIPRPTEYR
jgi:hypothetical protein